MQSPNSGVGMSQSVCPECGFSHPPTPGGCPMKKQTSPSGEDVDFNICSICFKLFLKLSFHYNRFYYIYY